MEESKDITVNTSTYVNNDDIERILGCALTVYDGEMSDIKNCDAILVSVNSNLVFLDGHSSIDVDDLVEYAELKERVDNSELLLNCGDSYVFTVKKESKLGLRGITYVIAIITPDWENGLNREAIVEKLDRGFNEAMILASYYDVDSIAISNVYPYMPTILVMDMISHYMVNYTDTFKELCAVRGSDVEAIYRMNVLVNNLRKKYDGDLYVRLGGDIYNDLLTKMILQ